MDSHALSGLASLASDSRSADAQLEQIIEAAVAEVEDGESLDVDELVAAHPQYAAQLRELLPMVAALVRISNSTELVAGHDLSKSNRQLGDFRILQELGRGGMGTVFEAEQISMGRRVALKVLPFAALSQDKSLQRFRNEVRAAAALDHPHIVSVYSVGEERDVHFYAMQLIRGQTLAQYIDEAKVSCGESATDARWDSARPGEAPPRSASSAAPSTQPVRLARQSTAPDSPRAADHFRTAARLGFQAAEALQHAHDQGVLHRDVKPGNLMLDRDGKLFITDFGLARIEADVGLTMTGDLLGTLRYMAPEQALAKRVVIDHRADVYSLGATLYELIALEPAFGEADRAQLLKQIASDEPRPLRHINRRIPSELETIVLTAMAKEPEGRYQTAQLMADDLSRFCEHRPIHARRPTLSQRFRGAVRRRPRTATVFALAASFCILAGTAALADRHRSRQENNRFLRISLQAANEALVSGHVDEARLRMREAQTRIDADQAVDEALAQKVAITAAEADRYLEFMILYRKARDDRSQAAPQELRDAVALYHVVEDADWLTNLRRHGLPAAHIGRVSEAVYELLLANADHRIRWSDYFPAETREEGLRLNCHEAKELLQRALAFHAPSRGSYWLQANCALILGDKDEEQRLRALAFQTPPHDAAELFYVNRDRLWGTVSTHRGYPAYPAEASYKDHREMLRLDPTYYNAAFFLSIRLMGEKRFEEALVGWYACHVMRPKDCMAIINRAECHSRLGQYDEAMDDLRVASAGPASSAVIACLAFNLATDPAPEMRDGTWAVDLATKACQQSGFKSPHELDALASAYAEAGDFEAAVKWSEQAVKLCDTYLREAYAERLASFREQKPWRSE